MTLSLNQKIAVALVILQGVFFAGWGFAEYQKQLAGIPITVKPVPVDPRDLLRGQYFILSYDFSRLSGDRYIGSAPLKEGQDVYALLVERDGLYVTEQFFDSPPSHGARRLAIKGRIESCQNIAVMPQRCNVRFGIEKYFVPEKTRQPDMSKTLVRLRVGTDHSVRIDTMLVDGKPFAAATK